MFLSISVHLSLSHSSLAFLAFISSSFVQVYIPFRTLALFIVSFSSAIHSFFLSDYLDR